jgi:hypothetical protein
MSSSTDHDDGLPLTTRSISIETEAHPDELRMTSSIGNYHHRSSTELHELVIALLCNTVHNYLEEATSHPKITRNGDGKTDDNTMEGILCIFLVATNTMSTNRMATNCALYLMESNPNSITVEDNNGRMSFTDLIQKWVE